MADYNPSVALGINAPDPQGGLNTLSKILGLGQQGLAIKGQQSENVTRAAMATEAAQNAKEKMAGAQLLSDPVGTGIVDADGNPTKDAQKIIYKAMPTTGSAHYQGLLTGAKSKVEFNRSVNNLSADERAEVGSMFSGAAAGAQSVDEVNTAAQNFLKQKEGLPTYGDFKTIVDTGSHIVNHVNDQEQKQGKIIPVGQESWRRGAFGLGRQVLGAAGVVGSGGVGAPSNDQIDTGGTVQPVVRAPALQGGAPTAAGPPIQKTIAPGVVTSPAGPLARTTAGGEVIPLTDKSNVNITAAQKIGQVGQAEGVSNRVQQALHQANSTVQAQDALTRAKAILESPESPNTGAGFEKVKEFKNFLSTLGIDTAGAEDMNALTKNLARYEASRATAAGLGSTDAARELAHNGSPGVQLDNKALQGIVNQSIATEKAIAAYAKVQSKTNDPQQMLKNETDFRNLPNVIKAYEYGMSRNPAEANAFLHQHGMTPKEMSEARKALKEFEAR